MEQNLVKNIESSFVEISSKDMFYFIGICIIAIILIGLFLITPSPLNTSKEECDSTLCNLI